MRIAQLVDRPQRRGAEVFASQLSVALRRRGHEVRTIYLHPFEGAGEPLPLHEGDEVLDGREDHPLERLGANPVLLWRTLRALDAWLPDVVQANGSRTVKYGALARRLRSGWRLVYRNIGSPLAWVRGARRRLFYRRVVMPGVDGVVALSRSAVAELETLYGQVPTTSVIPNAVDLAGLASAPPREDVRRALGTPPGASVVLFVGSLTGEKRPDRLARVVGRAFGELRESAELWVVGDGPLRGALEGDLLVRGLRDRTRLLGTRRDVPALLAAADALILTSDTEGVPAVVLEAAAQGLPVVSTRVGGLAECVEHGATGLLAAPDDEAGLADALRRVLCDEDLRRRFGAAGRARAQRDFSMESAAAAYEAFYLALRAGVPS